MTARGRDYVHGYDQSESERLQAQAGSVLDLLHRDTRFPAGSIVLEAGCGTGAQTVTLARNSPGARFVSFDRSASSLAEARDRAAEAGVVNVEFQLADLAAMPFDDATFDHVFICFVLEHLPDPVRALAHLRRVLKPGGSITVFEGDHGSTYFHPHSDAAQRAIAALVEVQRLGGGNAWIGRQLYPLLARAGFQDIRVSPRMVYVDGSRPDLADGFTRRTFTAMIAGVRESSLRAGLIEPVVFDAGVRALRRAAEPDGVFCYTFFKAVARPA